MRRLPILVDGRKVKVREDRKVGEAVALFRKMVLAEFDLDQMKQELEERVTALVSSDMSEYVLLTEAIERAADHANELIDLNSWAPSTDKITFRREVNNAGRQK